MWVLSVAIGFAVPVLGGWHVYMVARGETSIESHDNDYLERKAKEEGLVSRSSVRLSVAADRRYTSTPTIWGSGATSSSSSTSGRRGSESSAG